MAIAVDRGQTALVGTGHIDTGRRVHRCMQRLTRLPSTLWWVPPNCQTRINMSPRVSV